MLSVIQQVEWFEKDTSLSMIIPQVWKNKLIMAEKTIQSKICQALVVGFSLLAWSQPGYVIVVYCPVSSHGWLGPKPLDYWSLKTMEGSNRNRTQKMRVQLTQCMKVALKPTELNRSDGPFN
jgi:hypothetical protein